MLQPTRSDASRVRVLVGAGMLLGAGLALLAVEISHTTVTELRRMLVVVLVALILARAVRRD